MSNIYPLAKPEYQSVSRLATDFEISQFRIELGGSVGFSWLLQPEPIFESLPIISIEDLLMSPEFCIAPDKNKYFIEKCALSEEARKTIIAQTTGQASSSNWLLARKHRLTASKFGAVRRAFAEGSIHQRSLKI